MIPGNVGFDPLTLSSRDFFKKSASREYEDILFDYREAELKHLGKVRLSLRVEENSPRRICFIRKNMKI